MAHTSDVSSDPSETDTANVLPTRYRYIGRIVLVFGNLLMVASFFMPWLELETSFCASGPRCSYDYSPWYLIQPGVPGRSFLSPTEPVLPIVACTTIILACSVVVLMIHSRKAKEYFSGALYILCGLCLFITTLIMTEFYVALALDYPFFHTNVAYGSWLALGSFATVLLGVIIIRPEWQMPVSPQRR
jgi:multidrug transporter EmrE-like cation transporter